MFLDPHHKTSLRGQLSINLLAIPNRNNVNAHNFVLNFGDNSIIANVILPEVAQLGSFQRLAEAARGLQSSNALSQKFEDALSNGPVEFG